MLIVHVHAQVKREFVDAFVSEAMKNSAASLSEPGVARCDVMGVPRSSVKYDLLAPEASLWH